jgi:hypothetical protein
MSGARLLQTNDQKSYQEHFNWTKEIVQTQMLGLVARNIRPMVRSIKYYSDVEEKREGEKW